MKPTLPLFALACFAWVFPETTPAAQRQAPGQPNVIVFLTDDQGYADLSCHGNPVLQTPNFDKLHSQSVRLTDAAVMWNHWRLVHGKELFDLQTDPGQQKNVAAEHPEVNKKMRDHYEKWWAGVEPKLDDFSPISIGSDKENPVTLSAADWANVYCDNMQNLRAGVDRNGPWHLLVEQDGTYEIELRRWPKEADAAIASGVPPFKAVDGGLPAGKALPIAKARLKLGDVDTTEPVGRQDKGIPFTVALKAGTKTAMQTWFYDAAGQELCGAYFAYVRRK